MTCLRARRWYLRPFSFIWRCQNKSVEEQRKLGVEYLDIRIRRVGYKTSTHTYHQYRFCHGLVDLGDFSFPNLSELLAYPEGLGCRYRLLVERGDTEWIKGSGLVELVEREAPNCVYVGIKKPWTALYCRENIPIKDYSYVPFYTGEKPKGAKFCLSTIKRWARSHNPVIDEELIRDGTVHFMDYVGLP